MRKKAATKVTRIPTEIGSLDVYAEGKLVRLEWPDWDVQLDADEALLLRDALNELIAKQEAA